jgi:hypothetical protein
MLSLFQAQEKGQNLTVLFFKVLGIKCLSSLKTDDSYKMGQDFMRKKKEIIWELVLVGEAGSTS